MKLLENMCRDVQSDNCTLDVTLPSEKGHNGSKNTLARKQSNNKYIYSTGQLRQTFLEDTGQEWLFTLCDEGNDNGNKENMSNILHGVCKAINASVRSVSDSATAFKIKIALSSSDDQHKVPQTEKKHCPSEETGRPVRLYCAGENIERRNHYLDLAGIENFTSQFDNEMCASQTPLSPHQRPLVVTSDNRTCPATSPSLSALNSTKAQQVWREEQSCGLHRQHHASHCPPSHFKHTANGPVHRSHSKRLRPVDHRSPRRPVCCYGCAGRERNVLPRPQLPSCSLVKHHHLHEHHHHHHHHYHAV